MKRYCVEFLYSKEAKEPFKAIVEAENETEAKIVYKRWLMNNNLFYTIVNIYEYTD